jgi:hypothetical protein
MRPTIHHDGPKVGGGGVEGVEGADEDQAFRDRAGDSGAVPEVAQAGVRLAGDYAGDLGVADALDLAEGAADRLGSSRRLRWLAWETERAGDF